MSRGKLQIITNFFTDIYIGFSFLSALLQQPPCFSPIIQDFPPFCNYFRNKKYHSPPPWDVTFPGSRLQKAVTGCHPERACEPKDLRTYPLYALHTEAECEDSSITLRSSRNDRLFSGLMICQIWIRIANCYQRYCIFSTGMV